MNILLLGATGQIGYALAHALAGAGHSLRVLVRDRHKLSFPAAVTVIEAPTFTADVFARALDGIDHAIYGIGLPEQFQFDPTIFERVNLGLLDTFLQTLAGSSVRRLTYISTYEVFEPVDGIIREAHPVASEAGKTPYFRAMIQAYRLATTFAAQHDITLTTIHPAAVYGGLDTGYGFTRYIENLLQWRVFAVPFLVAGRFPVVHVDSLANGIMLTLDHPGPFIISDQMTDLQDIAVTLQPWGNSIVPPVAPLWLVKAGAHLLALGARVVRRRPLMAPQQVAFITAGNEPRPDKIRDELGWQPTALKDGLLHYLYARRGLPAL